MKRKFLAALLALVMVFSMIPVSASAAEATGNQEIVKLGYDTGVSNKTIKVVVQYNNKILDEYEVTDSRIADQPVTLSLIGEHANTYDIESVSVDTPGAHTSTLHYLHKDSYECRLSLTGSSDTPATFTVTLCDPLETPDIEGDEIDPGISTIEYRAFDHDMLKMLYVNGVKNVDENTEINDVKMHFVESYTVNTHEQDLLGFETAGNKVDYHFYTLSDASDGKGIPGNIRYIEITYTLDGAEESKTLRVYSGDLRYVNVGNNIYEIEANNDSTYIVAFYYEAGAELTTWSLYDVRFVDTGTALGSENMPADPTYGDGNTYIFTNWDKNVKGGDPFLPYEIVADDTVVYAKKTSSQIGGTEIHVMNTDNTLINRILELYNATNEDTLGTIDYDTVKIRVNGKDGEHTNENYYSNDWRIYGSDSYYNVKNFNTEYAVGNTQNTHIPHNEISSITVYFTVNDQQKEVTINEGTLPGQVSASLLGTENIIQILVNDAPSKPTEDELDEDDLNEILGGAITVQCVSEEEHEYKTLTMDELLENAYSVTKNANGTYTVTLDGDKYASAYGTYVSAKIDMGENIPHQLVTEEDAAFTITLKHDGIKWTFTPDPIVIEVTCEDGSGEEPTPTPDPDPTPEPTPTPTPTPDPGDDNNPPYIPPYIPPVDPDDSGVSDLLNTDDHIQYLFGYPEGTFGPENNMTRAEVAQMFYNLLLDQDVTITKTFDDVPANAWYAKAVNTLASLGVVSGVGNGDFEPERSITRAEFTSIAMKFAEGKTGGTNIFSDVKSTDWFYRAVVNSTQYGWIHGYGDGTFRPNNPITRVEVTAIVNNMLGREADVDFVTEHYDELNHFSDLVVTHWGYYHIVEATNDHDYTKPSSGENWTELN